MKVELSGVVGRPFYAEKLARMAAARIQNLRIELSERYVAGAIKTAAEIELLVDMAESLCAKVEWSAEEERLLEKANFWTMKAWDAVSSERY